MKEKKTKQNKKNRARQIAAGILAILLILGAFGMMLVSALTAGAEGPDGCGKAPALVLETRSEGAGAWKRVEGFLPGGSASDREPASQTVIRRLESAPDRPFWDSLSCDWYRERLSDIGKKFYDDIYQMLMAVLQGTQALSFEEMNGGLYCTTPWTVYADPSLSQDEVIEIAELFLYNTPQFFFIDNGFFLRTTWDSSAGRSYLGVCFVCFSDFSDGSVRRGAANAFMDRIETLLSPVRALNTTPYDRARQVHHRLCDLMTYGNTAYDQSAYSALLLGSGVCAAYSEAFAALCNCLGVETLCLTSADHQWNLVRLSDDSWYAVDVTWDDTYYGGLETYLCVSEYALQRDNASHYPEILWQHLGWPACPADYVLTAGGHVHSFDGGVVTAAPTRESTGTIVYTCSACGTEIYATLPCTVSAVAMYRLYHPGTHEHFYTADANEYRVLITEQGWNDEGIGWYAPQSGIPVYRLYNPWSTDHHYTTSLYEYAVLGGAGWTQEGIGWFSDPAGEVPVYRQFSPVLSVGSHNFTASAYERDVICDGVNWQDEGIGWHGVNPR